MSVRVAVIDSGVHLAHPHIGRVAGGAAFGPSDASYADALGHGTAVMAAIQEKAPEAEYYALRVFHSALRTRVEHLIEALEWCLDNRIDIVNLSLGTANPDHAHRFETFLRKAGQLTLIAATGSLPGTLPGVIAVNLDPECSRDTYRYCAATGAFAASGFPRPVPGVPQEFNLQGISFAVANLTGFAAQASTHHLSCTSSPVGQPILAARRLLGGAGPDPQACAKSQIRGPEVVRQLLIQSAGLE